MKDSILVFGGGQLQRSIINEARKLGFQTIVIDPNPDAIAKTFSDKFYQVSGDDFDLTLQLAKEYEVKGIITSATDHPILMMCRIAKELDLAFPGYSSCETLLDKGKFKLFLKNNRIPHAKGDVFTKDNIHFEHDFNYPVIIKPTKNSGSRGVIKCETKDDLIQKIEETLVFCKDGTFIIEEYIVGDEISVEAIVHEHKVHIIQITDKIVTSAPYNVELGHVQPSKYAGKEEEIRNLLQTVIDLTGLDNCAIHPELKMNEDGITIIEIGPRLGGDFITSRLVPLSTGVNMEELVIKIATKSAFEIRKDEKSSIISYLNFIPGKEVKKELTEETLKMKFPEVFEFDATLKKGAMISPITNSLNRYGYFIIGAEDRENVLEKVSRVSEYVAFTMLNN